MLKHEIVKRDLKTLESDGFIKQSPEEIDIDIGFKPLVDKYGADKAEYFSKLLNMFLRYLEKEEDYQVVGGLRGLGVSYHLKKKHSGEQRKLP